MLDSIRYAKRIQRSILPAHETLMDMFPDSFVFYQAKDIVSGDFYFSTRKMGRSFLAAVDCTGHGVPGAFMSLIAHNQLTRAINEYGILEPARILHWAEKGLSGLLNSGNELVEQGDGMEIGLMAIDQKKRVIEYAGAHRPLYRITNGQLIEYKGEPFSIGPVQQAFDVDKRFVNHSIPMVEGDMYYIFSDGFVSQFHGVSGKKYMTARFKQFLLKICNLPMEEQKKLIVQEYEEWRGDSPQIDDLLVIGMRIAEQAVVQMAGLSMAQIANEHKN
jgi:serine phosphatase RsbU (regulator of sigma subunit)